MVRTCPLGIATVLFCIKGGFGDAGIAVTAYLIRMTPDHADHR